MRLGLTGATGRFGTAFLPLARRGGHEVLDLGPQGTITFDISGPHSPDLQPHGLDWVVHAAALTDVDACERNPNHAATMNIEATKTLAHACRASGTRLLFLSTDYVFDGQHGNYEEVDPTSPLSVYGRSKVEGERLALSVPASIVARTSVLFGTRTRPDFVAWAVEQLRANRPMRIAHQRISPTSTLDLSRQVIALLESDAEGIFHTAGASPITRFEMVDELARQLGVTPLTTEIPLASMEWTAPRPEDSSLNVQKVRRVATPMHFRDAAACYLEALG